MVDYVACVCRGEGCIQNLVGKTEENRTLGIPRRRWDDNIKLNHKEIKWEDVDWIDLAQDRDKWRAVVNTAMHLRVP
jgi:hypothetical protein